MKRAGSGTGEDEIPAVHVLEAAQQQDRKDAEALLAGFDRPSLRPTPAAKSQDFVDYYARKAPGSSGPDSGSSLVPVSRPDVELPQARQIDIVTVITPRRRQGEGVPPWLAWPAVALLMLSIGGVVAYVATSDGATPAPVTAGATSAATTLPPVAAPKAIPATATAAATAEPAATGTAASTAAATGATGAAAAAAEAPDAADAARVSARRDAPPAGATAAGATGTGTAAAGATAVPPRTEPDMKPINGSKPPPRDDFLRDM